MELRPSGRACGRRRAPGSACHFFLRSHATPSRAAITSDRPRSSSAGSRIWFGHVRDHAAGVGVDHDERAAPAAPAERGPEQPVAEAPPDRHAQHQVVAGELLLPGQGRARRGQHRARRRPSRRRRARTARGRPTGRCRSRWRPGPAPAATPRCCRRGPARGWGLGPSTAAARSRAADGGARGPVLVPPGRRGRRPRRRVRRPAPARR